MNLLSSMSIGGKLEAGDIGLFILDRGLTRDAIVATLAACLEATGFDLAMQEVRQDSPLYHQPRNAEERAVRPIVDNWVVTALNPGFVNYTRKDVLQFHVGSSFLYHNSIHYENSNENGIYSFVFLSGQFNLVYGQNCWRSP
jgi:hypothetical protein